MMRRTEGGVVSAPRWQNAWARSVAKHALRSDTPSYPPQLHSMQADQRAIRRYPPSESGRSLLAGCME